MSFTHTVGAPFNVAEFEIESLYQPYGTVSGDLLEVQRYDDKHLGLFIADVAGKGVPASLVVARMHEVMGGPTPPPGSPAEIMLALNDALQGKIPLGLFVTAMYIDLNAANRSIKLVNCGHTPALVYRAGQNKVEQLEIPGAVLGVLPTKRLKEALTESSLELGPNDRFLTYTDGLSEAMNKAKVEYGDVRLNDAFLEAAPHPRGEFYPMLITDLKKFQAGYPIGDDLTVLTIRRLEGPAQHGARPVANVTAMVDTIDTLTGLPDRNLLRAWPEGQPTSLIVLDVDGLAEINRQQGREAGDAVLKQVAETLKDIGGYAGRIMGDEFFILLPATGKAEAMELANGLRGRLQIKVSAGLATYPHDGTSPTRILHRARVAMQIAKHQGGDRVIPAPTALPETAIEAAAAEVLVEPNMTGRDDELALIYQAIEDSLAGRPRLILVSGGAGSGRTRMLDEAARIGRSYDMPCIRVLCNDAQANDPYRVVIRVLESLSAERPDQHQKALGLLPNPSYSALAKAFPDLVSGYDRESKHQFESASQERQVLFISLSLMLLRWSRWGGVGLMIENGLSCDAASLELLRWMLNTRGFRSSILVDLSKESRASADETTSALMRFLSEHKYEASLWELELDPLEPRELKDFIKGNLMRVQPEEPFLDSLVKHTGGKPLKVTAWLRSLLRDGRLKPGSISFQADANLTNGASGLLGYCLDPKDSDGAELLDAAAVAGPTFKPSVLARAMGLNEGHVLDAMHRLSGKGVLRPGDTGFEFASETFRGERYHGMADDRRKELHLKIASAIQGASPSELAYHHEQAGSPDSTKHRVEADRLSALRFNTKDIVKLRDLDPSDELTVIPEFTEALDGETKKLADAAVRQLSNAAKLTRTYPEDAPALKQTHELTVTSLERLLEETRGFTIGLEPERLSINRKEEADRQMDASEEALFQLMRKKMMRSITIVRDIPRDEIIRLVKVMAENTDPYDIAAREDYWQSRADELGFTKVGIMPVKYLDKDAPDMADISTAAEALKENAETVRQFFHAIIGGREAKRVYPEGSNRIQENILALHTNLRNLLQTMPGIAMGVVSDGIVINGVAADPEQVGTLISDIVDVLNEHGIKSISFTGEVEPRELDALCEVLGRLQAKGEEVIAAELDNRNVQHIAVGERAFRYKEFGMAPGGERARGPVETAAAWMVGDEAFLCHRDSLAELVSLVDNAVSAKRLDLACRLMKRYVKILEKEGPNREAAAGAIVDAILRTGPRAQKFVMVTVKDAIMRLLQSEPPGPVLDRLSPASLILLTDCVDRGEWALFTSQLEGLRERFQDDDTVDKVAESLATQGKIEVIMKTFESDTKRAEVERAVRLLGSQSLEALARMIRESEKRTTRHAAAMALRDISGDSWKALMRGFSKDSDREVVLRVLNALKTVMGDLRPAGPVLVRMASHEDEEVASSLLKVAEGFGERNATEIVSKLIWRTEKEIVLQAITLAMKRKLQGVAADVLNLMRRAAVEDAIIVCIRYFQQVTTGLAEQDLIDFATKKKGAFGWAYAHPDKLRASAVLALGALWTIPAQKALKVVQKDKSPTVQAALGHVLKQRGVR